MDDSDITIKNKVNCHCNQILMSKIGNITLIFKFQSTNDLATNYGIIFELDNYENPLKIVDTHHVKKVSVNQLKWI